MKVELNRPTLDSVAPSHSQGSPAEVKGDQTLQPSEEDRATLSAGKANVETLATQVLNSPEIRQDKVEALRQAITSGQYKVDPGAIAEAMIRDSQ